MSKDDTDDYHAILYGWTKCGNCKQNFEGVLDLEMTRRFWRRYRSSQDGDLRYNSTKSLAISLGYNGEVDAANQLLDEASTFVGNDKQALLDLKLFRTELLRKNDQKLEALGLLQAMLPEAKVDTTNPHIYGGAMLQITDVLLDLVRYQEAHEVATELVAFTKAKYGLESSRTLLAVHIYAITCAKLGRLEEAKAHFEDVLTTQTRVLGNDHPHTQDTMGQMRLYGLLAVPHPG